MSLRVVFLILLGMSLVSSGNAAACSPPVLWSVAGAFDLAANGLLPAPYPQSSDPTVRTVPPSLLKAIGWVESRWHQFTPGGRPLVSYDFGYGIMQITTGMPGAFGDPAGGLDPSVQSSIASDYVFNIAYGMQMLIAKRQAEPPVGDGDPSAIETWYYALWAYNGWGWVNNPNNRRFTRIGTPVTNPNTFPYQERVLYLVAHPPRDSDGNPLWQPVPVTLPTAKAIGDTPGALHLSVEHRQPPPAISVTYRSAVLHAMLPTSTRTVAIHITNTGTLPWPADSLSLGYHLLSHTANAWQPLSPFVPGMVAFAQSVTPLAQGVLPGASETVRIPIRAPANVGDYLVVWDLEQQSGTWLDTSGILPRAQTLQVVNTAATPTPRTSPLSPTPGPAMLYIADTSYPDGSGVAPKQTFVKGWLVFNSGSETWRGWSFRLVSGNSFSRRRIPVPETPPCHAATILATLRAPRKAGTFRSAWELTDAEGNPQGERLTLVVAVGAAPPVPTPTPSPIPTDTAVPVPTVSPTPVG